MMRVLRWPVVVVGLAVVCAGLVGVAVVAARGEDEAACLVYVFDWADWKNGRVDVANQVTDIRTVAISLDIRLGSTVVYEHLTLPRNVQRIDSPDGQLAVALGRYRYVEAPRAAWFVAGDQRAPVRLTSEIGTAMLLDTPRDQISVKWAADSKVVGLLWRDVPGQHFVTVVGADGVTQRQAAFDAWNAELYGWSADGAWLAYSTWSAAGLEVHFAPRDPSQAVKSYLVRGPVPRNQTGQLVDFFWPHVAALSNTHWSPGSGTAAHLAFSAWDGINGLSLYLISPLTGIQTSFNALKPDEYAVGLSGNVGLYASVSRVAWSSDGLWSLFSVFHDSIAGDYYRFYVVGLDGTAVPLSYINALRLIDFKEGVPYMFWLEAAKAFIAPFETEETNGVDVEPAGFLAYSPHSQVSTPILPPMNGQRVHLVTTATQEKYLIRWGGNYGHTSVVDGIALKDGTVVHYATTTPLSATYVYFASLESGVVFVNWHEYAVNRVEESIGAQRFMTISLDKRQQQFHNLPQINNTQTTFYPTHFGDLSMAYLTANGLFTVVYETNEVRTLLTVDQVKALSLNLENAQLYPQILFVSDDGENVILYNKSAQPRAEWVGYISSEMVIKRPKALEDSVTVWARRDNFFGGPVFSEYELEPVSGIELWDMQKMRATNAPVDNVALRKMGVSAGSARYGYTTWTNCSPTAMLRVLAPR